MFTVSGSHVSTIRQAGSSKIFNALGAPVATPRRTTLFQASLGPVFSHAYLLSGDPVCRERQKRTCDLMRAARAPDGG